MEEAAEAAPPTPRLEVSALLPSGLLKGRSNTFGIDCLPRWTATAYPPILQHCGARGYTSTRPAESTTAEVEAAAVLRRAPRQSRLTATATTTAHGRRLRRHKPSNDAVSSPNSSGCYCMLTRGTYRHQPALPPQCHHLRSTLPPLLQPPPHTHDYILPSLGYVVCFVWLRTIRPRGIPLSTQRPLHRYHRCYSRRRYSLSCRLPSPATVTVVVVMEARTSPPVSVSASPSLFRSLLQPSTYPTHSTAPRQPPRQTPPLHNRHLPAWAVSTYVPYPSPSSTAASLHMLAHPTRTFGMHTSCSHTRHHHQHCRKASVMIYSWYRQQQRAAQL